MEKKKENVINKVFAKIPILNTPDAPIQRPTQEAVPIADIIDDIVVYKDGGAAIILESSSLNFGLLSEREQEAVVISFAAMINSLSFPVQIVVRTQRKNIGKYLSFLDTKIEATSNEKLKKLMVSYKEFINETIKKRNVLGKRFFVVIPFSAIELGISRSTFSTNQSNSKLPYTKEYVLKKIKTALYPKRDHIIKQCARLGLRARQVGRADLIALYYELFNPDIEAVKEHGDNKITT